jgi:hypothetical protein
VTERSRSSLSGNYDRAFHRAISEGSFRSASRAWPVVMQVLGPPSSVVDIGCGLGTWLEAEDF